MVTKQGWLVIEFPINVIDTHYDIITVHLYCKVLLAVTDYQPCVSSNCLLYSIAFLSVQHLKKLPNLGNNFF